VKTSELYRELNLFYSFYYVFPASFGQKRIKAFFFTIAVKIASKQTPDMIKFP